LRKLTAAAVLAASITAGPQPAAAQDQDFEALVEEALGRSAAPGAQAPSAVPPRIGVRPAPGAPPELAPPPVEPPSLAEPAQPIPPAEAEAPAPEVAPNAATAGSGERTLAQLTVDEVNAATFSAHAEEIHGASPLVLKAQILLDRAGASPGVIDAYYGGNVAKAIAAVETVLGLSVDGRLDPQVWAALGGDAAPAVLVEYTITEEDASYPFLPGIPQDYSEQAQLPSLYYTSPEERFGEIFHMDVDLLRALNPNADMRQPGNTIIVAAIEGQPVSGKISRIEADKARRQVRAYDAQDRLIVAYPATIGSADNPSPSGVHEVEGVAPDPVYYYNPENFVQGDNREKLELPPGPNNPVGTMWIDLSKPSYGIHGTPEPSKIDKTGSHGCVRLTNWDAEELAALVEPGVIVEFTE
jgi:lipoprotein-anchoring transpeptidase ErfK/SrfK